MADPIGTANPMREMLEKATLELKRLRGENKVWKEMRTQPIAVIGMGCRFPGGIDSPESFWQFLRRGGDAIREVPEERFAVAAISSHLRGARWAGLLDGDIKAFDADFFAISPREAASLDPQQRLLLEVTWEALEHAGQAVDKLAGSRSGVFIGMMNLDYQERVRAQQRERFDAYATLGNMQSTAAGRLSYVLDLQGPTLTVDTACSSSLVAVHLACSSLRNGECELALAGGVNLLLSATNMELVAHTQALANDGRCKTFDARADGFVRSEGCGVLVLKRLTDAQRDGDQIWALLRGSAVNHDGHSTGLSAPNVLSQQALLRQALASAAVSPAAVSYVEAHGTGTALGDPIEIEALAAVLGGPSGQSAHCRIGSVKTNLGHLESAAGVAGLMKVILALHHGLVPRHLHFQTLNPRIELKGTPFSIPTTEVAWERGSAPRIAGVSSFGISGTNAHVVVEEAPAEPIPQVETPAVVAGEKTAAPRRPFLLPLSARSHAALMQLCDSYRAALAELDPAALPGLVATASLRRSHHYHRLAVIGREPAELSQKLAEFAVASQAEARLAPAAHRLVFVFPGQGSQWLGMGRTLAAAEPAFRTALEGCEEALRPFVSWSLRTELFAEPAASRLHEIDVVQPLLWAIEVALAALWQSWGVVPDAVVGHSMGEVAAAQVAGILTKDDAARIICRRSALLRRRSGQGAMALVELSLTEAEQALVGRQDKLSIAANNGPRATVLSGDATALNELLVALEASGVFCRRVKVDVASHSPEIADLLPELRSELSGLAPSRPRLPMLSTVTGEPVAGPELDADYFCQNLRQPVLFAHVVDALSRDAPVAFVELSPHPILLPGIADSLAAAGRQGVLVPTLRREEDEPLTMAGAVAALYRAGRRIDWSALQAWLRPHDARPAPLPRYPWQRERSWIEPPTAGCERTRPTLLGVKAGHPLLGELCELATEPALRSFTQTLSLKAAPYLGDHCVGSAVVLPAAAYVAMALAAADALKLPPELALEALQLEQPLTLPPDTGRPVQLLLQLHRAERASFEVHSKPADGWLRHAKGELRTGAGSEEERPLRLEEILARCPQCLPRPEHYARLSAGGLAYGPRFQAVTEVRCGHGEALGRVRSPDGVAQDDSAVEVVLLDGCFQVLAALVAAEPHAGAGLLPVGIRRLRRHKPLPPEVYCHVVLSTPDGEGPGDGETLTADLFIYAGGEVKAFEKMPLVEVSGLALKRVQLGHENRRSEAANDCFYDLVWQPVASPIPKALSRPRRYYILADSGGTAEELRRLLCERGDAAALLRAGEPLSAALLREHPPDGVIYLLALDAVVRPDSDEAALRLAFSRSCNNALELVSAIASAGLRDVPRLFLITAGSQVVAESDVGCKVAQTPLWGFGRTLLHEHPEFGCKLIDLDSQDLLAQLPELILELERDDDEDQVALRRGAAPPGGAANRHAARLFRGDQAKELARPLPRVRAGERPFHLTIERPGLIERLLLREQVRRSPGPGEVEIEVAAIGLNFLDVLLTLGALPQGPDHGSESAAARRLGPPIGHECVGSVVAVGEGVKSLRIGEQVMALALRSAGTHVIAQELLTLPMPPQLSTAEAATVPLAFLTAHYSLHHVARLQAGERVLIHAASGGVGLAAVQLALRTGAEIFATAGSEEKRQYLRGLGVHHVFSSRELHFVSEIRERTAGEGVDVVLNCLSGDFIAASLELLRRYGRFVELGKRDYLADRRLGLLPFLRNLSFSLVDLRAQLLDRPATVRTVFAEVAALFARGELKPLPLRTYPITEAVTAFSCMARAEHIGKVVLTLDRGTTAAAPIASSSPASPRIRPEGSYLITGGLGGVGLRLAQWLVAQGARHLVLLGRSAPSAATAAQLAALRQQGAAVQVVSADVAQRANLEKVLAQLRQAGAPPFCGVIHAAGVLDDRTLLRLGSEQIERVMAPKVLGAWNLHQLLREYPLDLFVLCSSCSSLLGSPGQAHYTAANAFLDGLAHHRRALGLPALSINWGAWTEVGLAAAHESRGVRLEARGVLGMSPDECAAAFGRLLRDDLDRPQRAVMRFLPRTWQEFHLAAARSPFLSALLDETAPGVPAGEEKSGLAERLLALPVPQRRTELESLVREQVGRVLGKDPARIAVNTPLQQGGLDSLMAMELRNRLELLSGLPLNVTLIWRHPTVAALCDYLAGALAIPLAEATSAEAPSQSDTSAEKIARLLHGIKNLRTQQ
jgi:acyl transferase domain-containing protein/aryl carrier-like protein